MSRKRSALGALLGARIASLRAERGLTQEKLAWEADLGSKGYMSRIESGERVPSLLVIEKLAQRLDVEVRDLFIFPGKDAVHAAMEQIRKRAPDVRSEPMKVEPRKSIRRAVSRRGSPRK